MREYILEKLKEHIETGKKEILQSFFQTGKSGYAENDIFIGVRVPMQRKVAKEIYKDIPFDKIPKLLEDPIHEVRLTTLFIMIHHYEKSKDNIKKHIYEMYLKNTHKVNNWDLVDASAHKIVGRYIYDYNLDRKILYKLAESKDLWTQRISVVANWYLISKNEIEHIFKISKKLLDHKHHLIHKASGWMLREAGKKDIGALKEFIKENYSNMPRTMLRYSIEKFPELERKNYLKGEFNL